MKETPTDNEVEEALSGLTEMVSEQSKPGTVKPAQPAAPKAETAEEAGEDSDDENKWSMEELRKNLTNIDRDS